MQLKTRGAGDFKPTMHPTRLPRRYPLRETLTFICEGNTAFAQGQTVDISSTSIRFVTNSVVPVGARITLKLHLRSLADDGRFIVLDAVGKVLRAEAVGTKVKVAAEIFFLDDWDDDFAPRQTIH